MTGALRRADLGGFVLDVVINVGRFRSKGFEPPRHHQVVAILIDSFGGVASGRYSQLFGINRMRKDKEHGKYLDRDHLRMTLCLIGAQEKKVVYQKVKKGCYTTRCSRQRKYE